MARKTFSRSKKIFLHILIFKLKTHTIHTDGMANGYWTIAIAYYGLIMILLLSVQCNAWHLTEYKITFVSVRPTFLKLSSFHLPLFLPLPPSLGLSSFFFSYPLSLPLFLPLSLPLFLLFSLSFTLPPFSFLSSFLFLSFFLSPFSFPFSFLFPFPLPSISFLLPFFLFSFPLFSLSFPSPFSYSFHSSVFLSVSRSVRPIFEAPYLHNDARQTHGHYGPSIKSRPRESNGHVTDDVRSGQVVA